MGEGAALDRGGAKLEALAAGLYSREEPVLSGLALPDPGGWRERLPFLVKYAIQSGDGEGKGRLLELLRRMADSPLYDAEEGGFFEAKDDTRKALSTNAAWMLAALRLHLVTGDRLCLGLARGILRFLHSRLRLPGGGFGAGQAPDGAYHRLSARERALVAPPAVEPCGDGLSCFIAAQAFAKAGGVLGEPAYLAIARRSLEAGEGGAPPEAPLRWWVERGAARLALYHGGLEEEDLKPVREIAGRIAAASLGGTASTRDRSRCARFLLLASIQFQEERWEAAGRELVASLLLGSPEEEGTPEVLGNALLSVVYPPAVFTAVTDGSPRQKERVLDALRRFRTPYALVVHRPPSAAESMQALPRLYGLCGGATRSLL
ncbi:MAG: hypothetical protein ACP5VN_02620 [Acidobacteriota bacterium]